LRDSVDDFQLISVPGGFKKKASNMYGWSTYKYNFLGFFMKHVDIIDIQTF
jgi:hypothetical protein